MISEAMLHTIEQKSAADVLVVSSLQLTRSAIPHPRHPHSFICFAFINYIVFKLCIVMIVLDCLFGFSLYFCPVATYFSSLGWKNLFVLCID